MSSRPIDYRACAERAVCAAHGPGTRLVCISDTHTQHNKLPELPTGDVLIHGGDFSDTGKVGEIESFVNWFDSCNYRHRVFIAGNHDTAIDQEYYVDRGAARFHRLRDKEMAGQMSQKARELVQQSKSIYLEDSATILSIEESNSNSCSNSNSKLSVNTHPISFYGSPWQPEFCDWAFNLDRGESIKSKWAKIPEDVDVLITHGPPQGYGDRTYSGFRCGCKDLMENIQARKNPPRVHIFGHIHEDAGKHLFIVTHEDTHFNPTSPISCN